MVRPMLRRCYLLLVFGCGARKTLNELFKARNCYKPWATPTLLLGRACHGLGWLVGCLLAWAGIRRQVANLVDGHLQQFVEQVM